MHMLAHHPPIREASVRMLSEQMFSLPRAAHYLMFLLARWSHWLSTEAPLPWSLPPSPPDPHKHTPGLWGGTSKGEGARKGTEVGSKRAAARSTGPWTEPYKQAWVWPPGIGTLSQWKCLALDDSASDTAQEEEWRDTILSQTVSRLSKIGLLIPAWW